MFSIHIHIVVVAPSKPSCVYFWQCLCDIPVARAAQQIAASVLRGIELTCSMLNRDQVMIIMVLLSRFVYLT